MCKRKKGATGWRGSGWSGRGGGSDRKREDRLPGLNWNCHVRASEANQRKNNLYRIEFNCELCRRPCPPSSPPVSPVSSLLSPLLPSSSSSTYRHGIRHHHRRKLRGWLSPTEPIRLWRRIRETRRDGGVTTGVRTGWGRLTENRKRRGRSATVFPINW